MPPLGCVPNTCQLSGSFRFEKPLQSRAATQGVTCTDCPEKHGHQPSAGGDLSLRPVVSYVRAPRSFLLHSQLPSGSEHDASLAGSLPTLIRGMKCS